MSINQLIKSINSQIINELELKNDYDDEYIKTLIENKLFEYSVEGEYISNIEKLKIAEQIFNSIRGLGVLQPLVEDDDVTEIMVNGYDSVFIEKHGKVNKIDIKFESEDAFENIIYSIVSKSNRTVNEANPIVDARLEDGSRINVVLRPIVLGGPALTIRKFSKKPLTMNQLEYLGTISKNAVAFLETLVSCKYNILICGGTGCGKTTFLNALSDFIPKHERIITIEDSAELQIASIENLISMETRQTATEGTKEITIRDLIKTSLRMRPERIIVGEVRGPEAIDMLQAMNTGHDGSISTGHANSCKDILMRLETMVLMAAEIPLEAIRKQIASAIDIIIHLSRMRDGSRKVLEICEVNEVTNGEIGLNKLFELHDAGMDLETGKLITDLIHTGNKIKSVNKLIMAGMQDDMGDYV